MAEEETTTDLDREDKTGEDEKVEVDEDGVAWTRLAVE